MKCIDRQRFAYYANQLTGGDSRKRSVISAIVLLLVIVSGGLLLAWKMEQFEPDEGTLLSEIAKAKEGSKITQTLTDPENTALFFAYIDAMGETVTNLQVSRQWSLSQFTALVDGAKQAQAQLSAFSWSPGGEVFRVHCKGDPALADQMVVFLEDSGAFDGAVISSKPSDREKEYTIECHFT